MTQIRPTTVTVDLDAVRHNVRTLAAAAGTAEVCAVVKADAYGHGAVPVAQACLDAGATHLAIAMIEEARELRAAGITAPLLILSEPPLGAAEELLATGVIPTVYTRGMANALAEAGLARGRPVEVHLAFDTGMGRVGVPRDRWEPFLAALPAAGLEVAGAWTHLARADELTVDTTDRQLDAFDDVRKLLAGHDLHPHVLHAANTAGTLCHPRARLDMVRCGIGLYGLSPGADVDAAEHGLRPALRWTTEVRFAKHLAAGTPISYGHRWTAPTDGWLATLQVGYADGVPRGLTNRWDVLVDGVRRPVVGTVTMDMVHVWFGEDEPPVGAEVVLLGAQRDEQVRAEEWAATLDTITYEVTCGIARRVPRRHRP